MTYGDKGAVIAAPFPCKLNKAFEPMIGGLDMNKKVSQIEKSKHFSGSRTAVTYDEIKKWIELWPGVREKVASNLEAYQELSGKGLRYRDYRTIKRHLEVLLPLVNDAPIITLINFVNYIESRMPPKEFMRLLQERLPVEQVGREFASLVDALIKGLPPAGQVIRALGSMLAGGFPFDWNQAKG